MTTIKKWQTINFGEDVKKKEPSCTVGGKVNWWYNHYGEQYGDFLKQKQKLGIKLTFDQAIPLLGIDTEKTIIEKVTCIPMFIVALFKIARTWKQPRSRRQMNGWSWGTHIKWNITQPWK